jgi:hypothetical protein
VEEAWRRVGWKVEEAGRKARVEGGVGWGGRVVWKVGEDGRKGSMEGGGGWEEG